MRIRVENGEIVSVPREDTTGEFLRPPDIMNAMRDHFGVRAHPLSVKYPVGDTELPLLPLLS